MAIYLISGAVIVTLLLFGMAVYAEMENTWLNAAFITAAAIMWAGSMVAGIGGWM
jgi:hypothetical protein